MACTTVTFKADGFNTTEAKDCFINPCCFGDDVVRWLGDRLVAQGLQVDAEIGQEDFGWYLSFSLGSKIYDFVIGYRPDDDLWIGWIERSHGLLASLTGARHRGIEPDACTAVHRALSESGRTGSILWHERKAFETGNESLGQPNP